MKPFLITPTLSFENPLEAGRLLCAYPELSQELMSDNSFRRWLRESDADSGREAISAFEAETDPQLGLFKASYALCPVHDMTFMGKTYKDLNEYGMSVLKDAPGYEEGQLRLFSSGGLTWYIRYMGMDRTSPSLYADVERLCEGSPASPLEYLFLAAYRLTGERRFFFDGQIYPDIVAFFQAVSGDVKIMDSYDFITAPYSRAYHIACGREDDLIEATSSAETNRTAQDRLVKARFKRG